MASKRVKSVLVEDMEHCVVCGREAINIHHIFCGTAKRKLSDDDGYIIPLCHKHHNGSNEAIHFNRELEKEWRQIAQEHFERKNSRQAFIQRYGRSYL